MFSSTLNQALFFWQVGKRTNVSDMENDPFYKFIQKTYPLHPLAAAVALYAWGGLPYVVWGMVSHCPRQVRGC